MRSFKRLETWVSLSLVLPVIAADNGTEPCAQVAEAFGSATSRQIRVDPDVALSCLQSVPLHAEQGAQQLDGLKAFLEFQSTIEYLKDPPPGYFYPGVDLLGGLDDIKNRLNDNRYSNEYDFQLDIYKLIASAHDAHLTYTPDITQVFSFQRLDSLVSLSSDGVELPEVYLNADVAAALSSNSSNVTVPTVTQINGEDVEIWLNTFAEANGLFQDPDANYNNIFPNFVSNGYGRASKGAVSFGGFTGSSYHQNATTITYDNGTTIDIATFAVVQRNFTGVTGGDSFFQKFCTPQNSSEESSSPSPSSNATQSATPTFSQAPFSPVPTQTTVPAPPGFPNPLVVANDFSVAGYLLDNGVAVLSIPSFEVVDEAVPDFQSVIRELLATAKSQNASNLIIDVRANGGGATYLAFDAFHQIFPVTTPTATFNMRTQPLLNELGEAFSDFFSNVTSSNPPQSTPNFESPLNVQNNLKSQDEDYGSWADYYGPVQSSSGANFTELSQYNLNNPPLAGYSISGYGNLTDIVPEQVFPSDNITIVYDGACGSACAVFAELIKTQGKVKSVTFGGRKQTGPAQGVGNVKGAEARPFGRLQSYFDFGLQQFANPEQARRLNETYSDFDDITDVVLDRAVGTSQLNLRNHVRVGDDTLTPLQFIYEAADCRLFYTAEQTNSQQAVWTAAYNVMWNGAPCVADSTNSSSSQTLVGAEAMNAAAPGGNNAANEGNSGVGTSDNSGNATAPENSAASSVVASSSVISLSVIMLLTAVLLL